MFVSMHSEEPISHVHLIIQPMMMVPMLSVMESSMSLVEQEISIRRQILLCHPERKYKKKQQHKPQSQNMVSISDQQNT